MPISGDCVESVQILSHTMHDGAVLRALHKWGGMPSSPLPPTFAGTIKDGVGCPQLRQYQNIENVSAQSLVLRFNSSEWLKVSGRMLLQKFLKNCPAKGCCGHEKLGTF